MPTQARLPRFADEGEDGLNRVLANRQRASLRKRTRDGKQSAIPAGTANAKWQLRERSWVAHFTGARLDVAISLEQQSRDLRAEQ